MIQGTLSRPSNAQEKVDFFLSAFDIRDYFIHKYPQKCSENLKAKINDDYIQVLIVLSWELGDKNILLQNFNRRSNNNKIPLKFRIYALASNIGALRGLIELYHKLRSLVEPLTKFPTILFLRN
jgi:hypothetical protein